MEIEPLVKEILSTIPKSRGNDRLLMATIWQRQGLKLTPTQWEHFLTKCSSSETIRRERQNLQHKGQFLADETTRTKRKQKAQEMHDRFVKSSSVVMHFDNVKGVVTFS
jgi:hypothetical protein